MRRTARILVLAVAAALGVGASLAIGAGSNNVKACVVKSSGRLHATDSKGKCAAAEFAITIAGDAFKKRGGTLTINGVAFKRGSGKTITINGTPFQSGRGKTLTINGIPFEATSGGTLTINGTAFGAGAAAIGPTGPAGPAGAEGRIGPTGPPGIPYGPPPVEAAGPTTISGPTTLASASLSTSDGKAHRVLVTGGFDAVCNPCADALRPRYGVALGAQSLFQRNLPTMQGTDTQGGAVLSEIVVTPDVCGPCTFNLVATYSGGGSSGQASKLDASAIRLGLLDLGPVSP